MEWHSCSHRFSRGTKLRARIHRQKTLPHCHIKTATRTDFIGKYGLPLSKKTEKSFGSQLMTSRTFGKECWRSSVCKLCHSSSKSGRFIRRSGNHYLTKHSCVQAAQTVGECRAVKSRAIIKRFYTLYWRLINRY